jgi:tetratricopeptide (TPR) repeat protein
MKFRIVTTLLFCIILTTPLWAQMNPEVRTLRKEWALAKYQTPKAKRKMAFERLAQRANAITSANPGQAEPLVWEAIILASIAGELRGVAKLKAMDFVTRSKELLLKAKKINPNALNGSVYTSLGSLYYQVPGWPLGFGSDKKAKSYLAKGLQLNPKGLDQNYFYGDFLLSQGDFTGAIKAFEQALAAPVVRDRPVFDAGRRQEVRMALNQAKTQKNQETQSSGYAGITSGR